MLDLRVTPIRMNGFRREITTGQHDNISTLLIISTVYVWICSPPPCSASHHVTKGTCLWCLSCFYRLYFHVGVDGRRLGLIYVSAKPTLDMYRLQHGLRWIMRVQRASTVDHVVTHLFHDCDRPTTPAWSKGLRSTRRLSRFGQL